jgi:hypothetical protein
MSSGTIVDPTSADRTRAPSSRIVSTSEASSIEERRGVSLRQYRRQDGQGQVSCEHKSRIRISSLAQNSTPGFV